MIKKPLLKIIHFTLLFIIGVLFTIFLQKIKHSTVKYSEPFTEILMKPSECEIKTVDYKPPDVCEWVKEYRESNTCPNCDPRFWFADLEWQCTSRSRKCVNPCWWGCETCWDECNWELVPKCGKGCRVIKTEVDVERCVESDQEVKHEKGHWVDADGEAVCGWEKWYDTCYYNKLGDCERDQGNDTCVKRQNERNERTPPSYEKKIFNGLNELVVRGPVSPTDFECSKIEDCEEEICDCKLKYSDCGKNCKKTVKMERDSVGRGKACSHTDVRAGVNGNELGSEVNCRRIDETCDCKGITLPCSINCETGSNRFIVTQEKIGGGFNCDYPSDCEDGDGVCDSNRLKRVGSGGSWPDKISSIDELNRARQLIIPPWVGEVITWDEHKDKSTIDEDKLRKIYR